MIYDTLKLSKALRVSFTPEQSDTLARAFSDSTEDNVATKLDIAEVKTQVAQLKSEMSDLRTDLKTEIAELRTEFKTEIADLRTEFKTETADLRTELKTVRSDLRMEFAGLRSELKTDLATMKSDIAKTKVEPVRWIVGAIAFNLLGTLGLMIGVAELVSKSR